MCLYPGSNPVYNVYDTYNWVYHTKGGYISTESFF